MLSPEQKMQIFLGLMAMCPSGALMLTLAIATLKRNPRYLANIFFSLGFFMSFVALLINSLYFAIQVKMRLEPAIVIGAEKGLYLASTLGVVCFCVGQLIFLKGPRFVASRKGAAIVAAMTAGSFLVLLGKLYVSPGSLIPSHTFTSFAILFGVNLFYAALGLGTGFLLLSRLKGKTRRRYWRVQAGLTIMAVGYLSAMLRRIAAFPFPFIVVVLLAYNLGAVVLYLGLIRRKGYPTASSKDGVPPGAP